MVGFVALKEKRFAKEKKNGVDPIWATVDVVWKCECPRAEAGMDKPRTQREGAQNRVWVRDARGKRNSCLLSTQQRERPSTAFNAFQAKSFSFETMGNAIQ